MSVNPPRSCNRATRSKTGGARRIAAPSPLTYQPAYKPGSVWRQARTCRVTAIPLERRLPGVSSNPPGRQDSDIDPGTSLPLARHRAPRRPYSVLLPVWFAVPLALPQARCALTAPFHPYRGTPPYPPPFTGGGKVRGARRSVLCGTFPGVAPAGRYPAPYVHGARTFLPGGLSTFAGTAVQPTDREGMGCWGRGVKPAITWALRRMPA
jgi:hypothetical protein